MGTCMGSDAVAPSKRLRPEDVDAMYKKKLLEKGIQTYYTKESREEIKLAMMATFMEMISKDFSVEKQYHDPRKSVRENKVLAKQKSEENTMT